MCDRAAIVEIDPPVGRGPSLKFVNPAKLGFALGGGAQHKVNNIRVRLCRRTDTGGLVAPPADPTDLAVLQMSRRSNEC